MSRGLAVLCLQTVLFQTVTFLLRVTASYGAVGLDVGAALLGFLAAAFALVPLVLALPAGGLADRYGESRVMVAGAVLVAATAGVLVVRADSFAVLVSAMVVLGTGHLLCAVGQQSLVAELARPGRFDSAFGYYTFAGSVGQAAGAGLLTLYGASAAVPDTEDAFRGAGVLAVVLVLVSVLVRPAGRRSGLARTETGGLSAVLRTPALLRGLLVSSLVLAAMDVTLVYLPLLGAEEGLAVGVVSALLTARALATMSSRVLTGVLTAALGRRLLLTTSIAVSGVATAVVALPAPLWARFVAVVVMGFGLGVCQPVMLAWLAEISPPGLRGRVVSLRLVGNRLGQTVIPGALGLAAGGLGAAGVLVATAGGLLGAALATRGVPMDQEPDPE
ncbi:MFS transporter [Nocardioides caldifontis]|uniref:MFS transporter n=1 Tax=Nocardioides caldifontis TaxID=2588938 RepID=UPI0011DFD32D|nr:MFS transporter [Nocardioides caldifontis]